MSTMAPTTIARFGGNIINCNKIITKEQSRDTIIYWRLATGNLRPQVAKYRFRNLHARLKQGIPTFAYLLLTILPIRFC